MKKWIILALLAMLNGAFAPAKAAPLETDEIVIEMTGTADAPAPGVFVWDKNARQLTRLFRNKDRAYVLYTVDSVSTQDTILKSTSGQTYAFVQYGRDNTQYRKLIFRAGEPQTFVACAANPADVLAVFERYGVNLGLDRADFVTAYGDKLPAPQTMDLGGTTRTVYTVPANLLPLKSATPLYAVFQKEKLETLLPGPQALQDYKKSLEPKPQPAPETPAPAKKTTPSVRTALISGGTAEDQRTLPRVVSSKPLPTLIPSGVPAGTPVIQQIK